MKMRWCGVFKNDDAGKVYPSHLETTQIFYGNAIKDLKFQVRVFIREMGECGMRLVDQEI